MTLHYGIKVSSPGNDVATQSDKALPFTSKFSTLKVLKAGDISLTTNGSGDGSTSITHGFGFAPAYMAYQKCTASWSFMDASTHANAYVQDPGVVNTWGSDYHHTLHVYTDSDKLYLDAKGAQASTTYTIHYLLLIDLSEDYTGAGNSVFDRNVGFKISKPNIDVFEAKAYQLGFTSRCKSLQFYPENYKYETLTLPAAWSSPASTFVEEGTYVDINHGLGYPPHFMAFFKSTVDPNNMTLTPYVGYSSFDTMAYRISGFCDSTKVRLSFYRNSSWHLGAPEPNYNYDETVTLTCIIFTEDLSESYG